MVDLIAAAYVVGFFVLFVVPVLYFTWYSMDEADHAPATMDEEEGAGAAER